MFNLFITMRIALRALAKNKMRAGLTVLGVVIGIAAVTTMVSVGQSAGELVQEQFQSLGTNVLVVFPGSTATGRGPPGRQPHADRRRCPSHRRGMPRRSGRQSPIVWSAAGKSSMATSTGAPTK